MQARLRRREIEQFKPHASNIKPSETNPIVDQFLKVGIVGDYASVTKSNLNAFAILTVPNDGEDCEFLIDQKILFDFCELSDKEFINFIIDGNNIKIWDGVHNTDCPTDRAIMFPSVDAELIGEWQAVSQPALDAIKIAAEIVFPDQISGARNTVFCGNGFVAGSDATIGYMQYITEPMPQMVLRKEVAQIVSKLAPCKYAQSKHHDLFLDGDLLVGFGKSEVNYIDMRPIFQNMPTGHAFSINKNLLIKWNNYVSGKSKTLSAKWFVEGRKMALQLENSKVNYKTDSVYDVPEDCTSEFKFSPDTLNQLLKVLPCEVVHFVPGANRYYITDADRKFCAAIMLII